MIYLDNGAATMLDPEALSAMMPYLKEEYGNSFGVYSMGQRSGQAVERARTEIAELLSADPGEIYFTSGGTESDNWALSQALWMKSGFDLESSPAFESENFQEKGRLGKRCAVLSSAIEHPAVRKTLEYLSHFGIEAAIAETNGEGFLSPEKIRARIDELSARRIPVGIVSVMAANNEIGTLEPIREIAEEAHRAGALFHTDAVQAVGHIPLDVHALGIDFLSASGHKFGGPKGVGFLYIRSGLNPEPFLHGGAQERGLRAGTLNVPGVVGMGKAAALAKEHLEERMAKECRLRNHLIDRILSEIPGARLNGADPRIADARNEGNGSDVQGLGAAEESLGGRLPGNANFIFPGVSSEALLFRLDEEGIAASAGSACSAGAMEPSHVLLSIGRSREEAFSSLRLTLSFRNTEEEIDHAADVLVRLTEEIRRVK